jgi:hypothetical protein
MTTLRRFTCDDLFTFNPVNLDFFTETVRAIGHGTLCIGRAAPELGLSMTGLNSRTMI